MDTSRTLLPPFDAILLREMRPCGSGFSGSRCFYYSGQLADVREAPVALTTRKVGGCLIQFLSPRLRRRCVAVFARGESIRIDMGAGAEDLLPVRATIRCSWISPRISFETSAGKRELRAFTPPWRHFMHDGMCPEDVEPVAHMLEVLTDPDKRPHYHHFFSTGAWPEQR